MMDNTVELSEAATLKRFDASQDRLAKDFGFGDTAGAVGITKACIEVLAAHMSTALTEARTLGNNSEVKHFCRLIQDLEPEVVALSTLTCALGTVANDENLERHAVMSMGYAIAGECWAKGLLLADEKLSRKIDRVVRKRHGSLAYRKQAARSIATRAGYTAKHWEKKHVIVAGAWLLDQLLVALPDVFQLVDMEVGTSKALTITDGALELASAAVEQCLQRNPIFLPCTTPPKPWTDWHNGGYWDERSRLRASAVRTIHKETTAAVRGAMKTGVMKPHIDALNALQAVSWSINGPMLDVLKQCVEQGIEVKGLPSAHDVPPPTKPDVWEKMDEPAQRLWKYRAGQVKERNRSLVSNRVLLQHDFTTADLLVAGGSFWTPLNCDWRGRVYSVPHFSFQRDDRVRALFQFTDGAPIGRDGLRWLKIHVANCGDFDKISKQPLEERVAWTDANLDMIKANASRPMLEREWVAADKPFLFLAACMEITSALAAGPTFITHLPVSFDGSCSGLQHLTAMTRASEGALVNLTATTLPADVYQTVADVVAREVLADSLDPDGEHVAVALQCLAFGITRKLVKRNVMTYSYSSKSFGMSKQLEEDVMRPLSFEVLSGKLAEHPFGFDEGHAASKYLAAKVYAAIESVVDLPAQAMAMLQKAARAMAHEGKPISWTTPTGLPWVNRYHVPKVRRIELWLHDTRIQMKIADGCEKEIDKEKAANGVAPNFVHALDASHLMLTVNASISEDITQLATVHDSFGCLASKAARFNAIIREQFVKMYVEHDVLAEVLEQAKHDLTEHNQHRLPNTPAYGPLNINEVINAQYAFA